MAYKYSSNQCGSCYWLKDPRDDNKLFNDPDYIKGHCIELKCYYYPDDAICSYYKNREASGGGCYITTMVCSVLGYDNHCEVLETLREFRKDVLQKDKKYSSILHEYDTVGPQIAENLEKEDKEVVTGIFDVFLKPITKLLKEEKNDEAVDRYQLMTKTLEDYYSIEYDNSMADDYNYTIGGHGVKPISKVYQ